MTERATIRRVEGGFIVEVRWPYGGEPIGNGEVVCTTFADAVQVLAKHVRIGRDPDPWMDVVRAVLADLPPGGR